MKYFIQSIRFFVGITFIISGFVKLIDPMGFSFKLEEYFAIDVLNLPFLTPFAFILGIAVVITEIVLGVMLLIGYRAKFTLYSLLALTIFFGFLTFYSAYFNKVTDCGCFGDAVKFTPWQSFFKDMFLMILILIIIFGQKYIRPFFSNRILLYISILSVVFCISFTYYTYTNLPVIDFRAYKIGTNIQKSMEIPENAPQPVFNYHWTFNVNGRDETITTQGAYPEVDGDFVRVVTEQISKGYTPPIHDFTIEKDGTDYTEQMLQASKLIAIISYDLEKADINGVKNIKEFTDQAQQKGYKVIGMTASISMAKEFATEHGLNFDFYLTDQTTLKTIVRSNPAILVLEKGTIVQKENWRNTQKIHL